MSMEYIRKTYGVPAKRGAKIEINSDGIYWAGTIVGARGGYLRVRVPGCERILTMHPTWRIFYLAASCVASA